MAPANPRRTRDWQCRHRAVANDKAHWAIFYHVCTLPKDHYGLCNCWCGINFHQGTTPLQPDYVQTRIGEYEELWDAEGHHGAE